MVENFRLLELVRQETKRRKFSRKTENAYAYHIGRFLEFHAGGDLQAGRADKVRRFLEYLRTDGRHGASALNQARCALLFLYRDVLGEELSARFGDIRRAPVKGKQPVIFTAEEVGKILSHLRGESYLIAALMYGSGLRLSEAVALRVGDIDFERREIIVRSERTFLKNRATVLPELIAPIMLAHLGGVRYTFEDDCLSGFGNACLPESVLRRSPDEARQWSRQYVFPSKSLSRAENGSGFCRRHYSERAVQNAVAKAIEKARIFKPGCCQTLRYSFAARLFERNCSVYTIQNLLGHKNLKTTMSYLNLNGAGASQVFSPLDG